MPYLINGEVFRAKVEITTRCRMILLSTPDATPVADDAAEFLLDLFQNHDEWEEKSTGGISHVSTQTTPHGTRCFVLYRSNGDAIDISFTHAIKLTPTARTASILPQALRDFQNACRQAVRRDIFSFRDEALRGYPTCPITGETLTRQNAAVDHTPPNTFDQILFAFCWNAGINPLAVRVMSVDGTVPVLSDDQLTQTWRLHHNSTAQLRLVSKLGNLKLKKTAVPWPELWSNDAGA